MNDSSRDLMRRRDLLRGIAGGAVGMGLAGQLATAGYFGSGASIPGLPAKAKRVIFLFMTGGPSQMDLFDYKPELQRRDGQTVEYEKRRRDKTSSVLVGSQRKFKQYGETGQWCSDAFRYMPEHMDKLAVIKSLYTDSFAHGSALLQMNSGQFVQGHPSMGSWIHYALGSENPSLPGFVVMHDPRGGPISGAANWTSGYMPATHQGTLFRATGDPLLDMTPALHSARARLAESARREQLETINFLNKLHLSEHGPSSELSARAASHELAWNMQASAPEALDVGAEDERTREMYGMNDPAPDHPLAVGSAVFGRQCLIARRLIERDVRFVQIYHGGGHQQQTWDAHHGVEENLSIHCPEVDRPISGLLTDLEQRGLLDETLVIWGGEFGRQPVSQQASPGQVASTSGRDHNPKGFTMWLAGAGVRPGPVGETDELGMEAAVDRHHIRDLHATILHLMGLDHHQLTYPFGGLDRKLTGVIEPELIRDVIA
jgi:hypothetical protein